VDKQYVPLGAGHIFAAPMVYGVGFIIIISTFNSLKANTEQVQVVARDNKNTRLEN